MVSKRWQKHKLAVFNGGLAAITLVTLLVLESDRVLWERGVVLAVSYVIIGIAMRQLNKHYADAFVKVFVADPEKAIAAVRNALMQVRMPYTMTVENGRVRFLVNRSRLSLIVEDFPLNLPVDTHLVPVQATKITLKPDGEVDRSLLRTLRHELDRYLA